MDWTNVGTAIAPMAPVLGRLLGGLIPIPFGSAVGDLAGQAIALALGVPPTAEAVHAAVTSQPADVVAAQLQAIEAEAAAKWQALGTMAQADATVGVAQVGATSAQIAAELVSGAWYQRMWRPAAMFMWVGTWPFQLGAILWHISLHDPATISSISGLVYALCAWNASPAALAGVYAYGRSQEKIAAAKDGA